MSIAHLSLGLACLALAAWDIIYLAKEMQDKRRVWVMRWVVCNIGALSIFGIISVLIAFDGW